MPKPPGVTAVIPTHNRPEMMRRAVISVLDQDYEGEIEIVVVFDACEEQLPDIPKRHNRKLRSTSNHRTRGLAGARNTGIAEARHDYVAFLDDDDAWTPTKLTAQMSVFAAQPDTELVGTAMRVDAVDRTHLRTVGAEEVGHRDLLHDRLAGLHSSSFVFRKSALSTIGGVDEELPGSYGEDYDLLLRTAKIGTIRVVDAPLTAVTWQGQSYFFGKWAQYAEALTWLLGAHPEFADYPKALGRIESQIAFAHAASANRKQAKKWAMKALRNSPTQIKALLALAISLRLMSAPWVIRTVQRMGKGI